MAYVARRGLRMPVSSSKGVAVERLWFERLSIAHHFGKDAITTLLMFGIGCATNSVAGLGKFSVQRYSSAAPFDCGITPLNPEYNGACVKNFDLFGIEVAVSAGLCGAVLAFSPGAAAAPLPAGGPTCLEEMAGVAAPMANSAPPVLAVLPGPPAAAGAPLGAVPAGAPVLAGAPAGAPVAAGAPAGAPVAAGAPAGASMPGAVPAGAPPPVAAAPVPKQSGAGKGVPTGPALSAGPVVLPGPPPVPTPPSPVPVARPTLVSAAAPLPPCCNP
jgi:hypothetical protein